MNAERTIEMIGIEARSVVMTCRLSSMFGRANPVARAEQIARRGACWTDAATAGRSTAGELG